MSITMSFWELAGSVDNKLRGWESNPQPLD
jgi:hypothetical protein